MHLTVLACDLDHRLGEDLLRERGVPADPLFWKGHPAEGILRAARVENCDLIVEGTRLDEE